MQYRSIGLLNPNTLVHDGYLVFAGDDDPVDFNPAHLRLGAKDQQSTPSIFPGVQEIGEYITHDADGNPLSNPVVTFLYNKHIPGTNVPEIKQRVVVVKGYTYGVHPNHGHQPETFYLLGAQIGTYDSSSINFDPSLMEGAVKTKYFSVDCMYGSLRGEAPLSADTVD